MAAPSQTNDSISCPPSGVRRTEVVDAAQHFGLHPRQHGDTLGAEVQSRHPLVAIHLGPDQEAALGQGVHRRALTVGLPMANRLATREALSSPEAMAASTR